MKTLVNEIKTNWATKGINANNDIELIHEAGRHLQKIDMERGLLEKIVTFLLGY